jgi:D-alanyl-lipoteichoic acid acyltransferase DltB (MBOAT superfamily)
MKNLLRLLSILLCFIFISVSGVYATWLFAESKATTVSTTLKFTMYLYNLEGYKEYPYFDLSE